MCQIINPVQQICLRKKFLIHQQRIDCKNYTKSKLQTVVKHLQTRNLLISQEIDTLKHLDQGSTKKLVQQTKKENKKKLPINRTYKVALQQFALSLHFYLPKAYIYVHYKFYNSLPHPKIISRWYESVHGELEIITEALEAIKQVQIPYRIVGTLVFDVMAIRQHIDYYKGKIVGYVNCGAYLLNVILHKLLKWL